MSGDKLTRRKVGGQKYDLVDKNGRVVGAAVKTGTHLDSYPWDWSIDDALVGKLPYTASRRTQGTCETLRDCVDQVTVIARMYQL